jgi:hypothetical protein
MCRNEIDSPAEANLAHEHGQHKGTQQSSQIVNTNDGKLSMILFHVTINPCLAVSIRSHTTLLVLLLAYNEHVYHRAVSLFFLSHYACKCFIISGVVRANAYVGQTQLLAGYVGSNVLLEMKLWKCSGCVCVGVLAMRVHMLPLFEMYF